MTPEILVESDSRVAAHTRSAAKSNVGSWELPLLVLCLHGKCFNVGSRNNAGLGYHQNFHTLSTAGLHHINYMDR